MINKKYSNNIIVRLDAGMVYGLGHLSRCLSLTESFKYDHNIYFIIKTDDESKIISFISSNCPNKQNDNISFIPTLLAVNDELDLIVNKVNDLSGFLIVDHYTANSEYQMYLRKNGIKWLQFDSHGFIDFYADFVLHGSPGATHEIYDPLVKYYGTKLLLGTQYAIVNKNFSEYRRMVSIREKVNRIIICFGGGKENGATLKCINYINKELIKEIEVFLIVSDKNPDIHQIRSFAKKWSNINLIINCSDMHRLMAYSDLAIIAPGTLSYEAASLGLPMLLVTIADNQNINVMGWTHIGAARSLGTVEYLNPDILNSNLNFLINNTGELRRMSANSMNSVDGLAPERIRKEILSKL